MWYNSFRHLVKRSNGIHIQKKLLVLLQEVQLIYVVNFLYIFPLISLPCCPLPPFFFTTLRNSDVPAATSTGGECLQWCQPGLPAVEASNVCCFSNPSSLISPVGNCLTLGSSLITYLLWAGGFPCCLIDSNPNPISSAQKTARGNLSCRSRIKALSQPTQSCELWLVSKPKFPGCLHFG